MIKPVPGERDPSTEVGEERLLPSDSCGSMPTPISPSLTTEHG
jgi:hypothetical protein